MLKLCELSSVFCGELLYHMTGPRSSLYMDWWNLQPLAKKKRCFSKATFATCFRMLHDHVSIATESRQTASQMHQPASVLRQNWICFSLQPFWIQSVVLVLILVCFGVLVARSFLDIGLFLGFWLTFDWICLRCLDTWLNHWNQLNHVFGCIAIYITHAHIRRFPVVKRCLYQHETQTCEQYWCKQSSWQHHFYRNRQRSGAVWSPLGKKALAERA